MRGLRLETFSFATILVSLLCLSGCAPPGSVMLDRGAASTIHNVVIVGPPEPRYLVLGSGAPVAFALGGAIVGAAITNALSADFNDQMKEMNVHIADELRRSLADALKNEGYGVTQNVVERFGANLLFNYSNLGESSDAILDAWLIADYSAGGLSSAALSPVLELRVRLVDSKTHKTLFGKGYTYDLKSPMFPADPRYTFPDRQSLSSNPQLAAEGLRAGIPLIVAQLQQDLNR